MPALAITRTRYPRISATIITPEKPAEEISTRIKTLALLKRCLPIDDPFGSEHSKRVTAQTLSHNDDRPSLIKECTPVVGESRHIRIPGQSIKPFCYVNPSATVSHTRAIAIKRHGRRQVSRPPSRKPLSPQRLEMTAIDAAVTASWPRVCVISVVNSNRSKGAGSRGTTIVLPGGTGVVV